MKAPSLTSGLWRMIDQAGMIRPALPLAYERAATAEPAMRDISNERDIRTVLEILIE